MNTVPTGKLLRVMKDGAKLIGERFTDPDADWAPIMMFVTRDGQIGQALLDLPDDFAGRDVIAEQITALLSQAQAVEACLVVSTWVVDVPEGDWEVMEGQRPRDHPDRREALSLTWVTADHAQMEMARIKRYPGQPPKLAAWYLPAEGINVSGRFVDAMRKGIYDDDPSETV